MYWYNKRTLLTEDAAIIPLRNVERCKDTEKSSVRMAKNGL